MSQPEAQPVQPSEAKPILEQLRDQTALKDYDHDIDHDIAEIRNTLFGVPPDTPEGKFVKNAYDRLHSNDGYKIMKERIMLAIRDRLREIQAKTVEEARAQGENIAETRKRLGDLREEFLRTVSVMGQSMKTQNAVFAERKETGVASDRHILDMDEGVILQRFAEQLEKVDFEELSVALIEDQGVVTMLTELQKQSGNPLRDTKPMNMDFKTGTNIRKGKLDPPEATSNYEGNPLYDRNMAEIRDFIIGRPAQFPNGKHGQERSETRRRAEGLIWVRLVANMNLEQKRDLIETFLKDPAPNAVAITKDFIQGAILSGAMSRQEAMEIYGDKSQEKPGEPPRLDPLDPELKKKLDSDGKDFSEWITQSVKFREKAQANIKYAVSQVEHSPVRNFVGRLFTFDNLIMGRVMDMGVITTVVNVALDVGDAVRFGKKGELGKNLLQGLKTAATDKYVAVGLGMTALGSNYVFPWIKDWILSPSKEQERQERLSGEYKKLRDETTAHPAISTFFNENFSSYISRANKNDQNGKGNNLLPEDVQISQERALDMGYTDSPGMSAAEAAQANVQRIFKICTKDLKDLQLNSADRLKTFFAQVVDSPNTVPAKSNLKSAKA